MNAKRVLLCCVGACLSVGGPARGQFAPGHIFVSEITDSFCIHQPNNPPDRIWEVDPDTGEATLFVQLPECVFLTGLAFNPEGTRLRGSGLVTNQILEFDSEGNMTVALDAKDGINGPWGLNNISYDAEGNFYVVNHVSATLMRFPADGGPGEVIADFDDGIAGEAGIAFAADGDLYLSGGWTSDPFNDDSILRFTPPDWEVSVFDSYAENIRPGPIAADQNGYVYVWLVGAAGNPSQLLRYEAGDPASGEVFAPDLSSPNSSMTMSADQTRLYVVNRSFGARVVAIDITDQTLTVVSEFPEETRLEGIAVVPVPVAGIPTASQWSVVVLGLSITAVGTIVFRIRLRPSRANPTFNSSHSNNGRTIMYVSKSKVIVLLLIWGIDVGWSTRANAQLNEVGAWGPVLDLVDVGAEHMILLKNRSVLLFRIGGIPTRCRRINYPYGAGDIGPAFNGPDDDEGSQDHALSCSGHSGLADGRIAFIGSEPDFNGVMMLMTTIYDPDIDCAGCSIPGQPCCWKAMTVTGAGKRFYPTCTTLWNGTVLTIGGWLAQVPDQLANRPMIFDPTDGSLGSWIHLPNAEYCPSPETTCAPGTPYPFHLGVYPFMFLVSSREPLYAGVDKDHAQTPFTPFNVSAAFSRVLDIPAQSWTDVSAQKDPIVGGSAVMYGLDRIMKAGGTDYSDKITGLAYTLDASSPTPTWTAIDSLTHARREFYLIALPDGSVLGVGGRDAQGFVSTPERYDPDDPVTGWTPMADMTITANDPMHSSAVLLPDARVLFGTIDGEGQVFSPPYLFDAGGGPAQRPQIVAVNGPQPDKIAYGQLFTVTTNSPPPQIAKVSLIRLGAATHAFDQNQRFGALSFTQAGTSLSVTPPADGYEAPPGYYMLFIVADNGVPSEAAMVQLLLECTWVEDCCDVAPADGIRDDNCVWCECTAPCVQTALSTFADMGGPSGGCPPDGLCNTDDRDHAMACFSGLNTCEAINIDAGGSFGACPPDGFCNIHDANHALSCFSGTNTCGCGESLMGSGPPEVVGQTAVSVVPSQSALLPGQSVTVRVFVDQSLGGLQSYQLHLGVSGGVCGRLELVDIALEGRADAVFDGVEDDFEAVNVEKGQLIRGLESGNVETADDGYLGTFTYRASDDASGQFVIDLLHDESAGEQTFFVSSFRDKIKVISVTPAVITVTSPASDQ